MSKPGLKQTYSPIDFTVPLIVGFLLFIFYIGLLIFALRKSRRKL